VDRQPWIGVTGCHSFYAWKVGDKWYGLVGGNAGDGTGEQWQTALAQAASLGGKWQYSPGAKYAAMASHEWNGAWKGGYENLVVTKLQDDLYVAIFDTIQGEPLSMIREDDGTYTCFYTAADKNQPMFWGLGAVKLKLHVVTKQLAQ
jgi:hypothetical protein